MVLKCKQRKGQRSSVAGKTKNRDTHIVPSYNHTSRRRYNSTGGMSQNAKEIYCRFSHLLQPIRDLTKNWDVDVASQLEEYLEEVSSMCSHRLSMV